MIANSSEPAGVSPPGETGERRGSVRLSRAHQQAMALLLAWAACAAFYKHSAWGGVLEMFTTEPRTYYSQLADAFRHGRLSLMAPPRPELLALSDPYDPALNGPYRMHDASLYRGKYYLYYGVTPAVVLHMPFHRLTGLWPSDLFAVMLFLTIGTAFWLMAFYAAIRSWLPDLSPVYTLIGGLAIAFCSTGPFVLARSEVYEVCLSASYCFVAVFFLAFQRALSKGPTAFNLAFAGSALALAVGCRPPVGLVLPLAACVLLWSSGREGVPLRQRVRRFAAFVMPAAVAGLLMAGYNYARFDNPLEFGNTYQLALMKARTLTLFSGKRMPLGLHYYGWAKPLTFPRFPFVKAAPTIKPTPSDLPPYVEPVAGVMRLYPFLSVLLLLPFVFWRRKRQSPGLRLVIVTLVATGTIELLLLSCFAGYTMRYELEFVPPLVLAAVLGVCWIASGPRPLRWVGAVLTPTLLVGALQGLLLGFTGYGEMWGDSYERRHPGSASAVQATLVRWLAVQGQRK